MPEYSQELLTSQMGTQSVDFIMRSHHSFPCPVSRQWVFLQLITLDILSNDSNLIIDKKQKGSISHLIIISHRPLCPSTNEILSNNGDVHAIS